MWSKYSALGKKRYSDFCIQFLIYLGGSADTTGGFGPDPSLGRIPWVQIRAWMVPWDRIRAWVGSRRFRFGLGWSRGIGSGLGSDPVG